MNSEDMNDAELDAFLKGEDALSGELQAMQQASPSAELDAAILGRAQAQMARDSRAAAANDASDGVASKAPLSRLGLRWRVPAGIAATLMAGVLAHQAWQASADHERAVAGERASAGAACRRRRRKWWRSGKAIAVAAPEPSCAAAAHVKAKQAAPRRSAPAAGRSHRPMQSPRKSCRRRRQRRRRHIPTPRRLLPRRRLRHPPRRSPRRPSRCRPSRARSK